MDKASRFCFITAIAIGCLMSFALAANSRFSSFNFFGGDQSTNNAYMFSQFYAAAVDPVDNSVYLYGHSTLALNNNLTSPRGSVDVVLIKLLSNGSVGWSKTIGGSDNDLSIMAAHFWHGKNIAIDPQSRDVVIQGNTQSPIFEGEPKVSAGNNWDAFLIRYHRNGTLIAMTIYGQTGSHVMPTDLFIYGNETYVVGSNYGGFAGSSFVGWWSAFLFRFRLMVIEGQLKLNPSFLKPVFLIGESPTNSHTFGYAIDIWNDTVHIAGSTAGNMPGYM
jgi:hypothetical protein